jgi:hypothetical protein
VDATVIASASARDEEAAWAGHKRRKATHGFKAYVAADTDTAFVEELTVAPGNVNDERAGGEVLPAQAGYQPALARQGTSALGATYRALMILRRSHLRCLLPHGISVIRSSRPHPNTAKSNCKLHCRFHELGIVESFWESRANPKIRSSGFCLMIDSFSRPCQRFSLENHGPRSVKLRPVAGSTGKINGY